MVDRNKVADRGSLNVRLHLPRGSAHEVRVLMNTWPGHRPFTRVMASGEWSNPERQAIEIAWFLRSGS